MPSNATALPPFTGQTTSRQAAESIAPRLSDLQGIVLAEFRRAGGPGMTDAEATARTGLRESTARARRVELVELGLVVATDERRKTPSGRSAVVWRVADAALPSWQQSTMFDTAVSAAEAGY